MGGLGRAPPLPGPDERPRRGRALRPGDRTGQLLHPACAARPTVAVDTAHGRRRLRHHLAAAAVRDAAPGRLAARTAAAAVGDRRGDRTGHVVMPALTRLFAGWLRPSRD